MTMAWGIPLGVFTLAHVLVSLVGIASGFVVMRGLLSARPRDGWTALFLITTVATSVSGFGFPADHVLPSHVVGVISLVVLAITIFARYVMHLAGAWRWIYVISAALALYLNVFVGVVQAFLKVSPLKALAPHQTEPPFVVTQLVVLSLFVLLTIVAAKRFLHAPTAHAS
jgi:hypothetical protein